MHRCPPVHEESLRKGCPGESRPWWTRWQGKEFLGILTHARLDVGRGGWGCSQG